MIAIGAAEKPPLCKGRWHGTSRAGGIVPFLCYNPPVSFADSPLYTRGPFCRSPYVFIPKFLSVHILDYYFANGYAIMNKIMPKGDRYGTYF